MQPYLEQYLDNLENLSPELNRNFKLVYELDTRVQDTLIEIDNLKQDYQENLKSYNNDIRLLKAKEIDQKYEKCKELSDEKVQVANQTYELVDKYIRRLDTDMARFEEELSYYRPPGEMINPTQLIPSIPVQPTPNVNNSIIDSSKISISLDTTSKSKKKKKGDSAKIKEEPVPEAPIVQGMVHNEVLDMPVDPNEPTYCLCKQVSYGEMVGCDNTECEIEWFHFGCVGLTLQSKPKGKWYCPICSEKRKK